MNEIKIHDIKALVEVPDYSMYIYYGLIILSSIALLVVIYFIYKIIKNKKVNVRREYFDILNNLDLNNSKQSAYVITKYGYLLAQNEREKQLLGDLISSLELYKYKKNVPSLEEDIKTSFSIFMDALDV